VTAKLLEHLLWLHDNSYFWQIHNLTDISSGNQWSRFIKNNPQHSKNEIVQARHLHSRIIKQLGLMEWKIFKILGISIDSRTIKAGELLCHSRWSIRWTYFISKAIEMGASGSLWTPMGQKRMQQWWWHPYPGLTVENTIHALGILPGYIDGSTTFRLLLWPDRTGKHNKKMLKSISVKIIACYAQKGKF